MDAKTKAIVAHITLIGWIIALVVNGQEKEEYASYYIRQVLGIFLFMLVTGFIPILGLICALIGIVMWIVSLVGAASGEMTPLPVVGEYFQDWFKGI